MQPVGELPKTWTFADLQALPEDVDWRRYEIVDGSLVVSPSTDFRHEVVSALVRRVLDRFVGPEFIAVARWPSTGTRPTGSRICSSRRCACWIPIPTRFRRVTWCWLSRWSRLAP